MELFMRLSLFSWKHALGNIGLDLHKLLMGLIIWVLEGGCVLQLTLCLTLRVSIHLLITLNIQLVYQSVKMGQILLAPAPQMTK